MQEKKDTFDIFLRRTDFLAHHLKCEIERLPDMLGISRASLFGYRSGARPITNKAWRKLEAAERAAGLGHVRADEASQNQVRADLISAAEKKLLRVEELSDVDRLRAELSEKISALTTVITEQNKRIDALLEQRAARTSPGEARSSSSPGDTSQGKMRKTIPKKLA